MDFRNESRWIIAVDTHVCVCVWARVAAWKWSEARFFAVILLFGCCQRKGKLNQFDSIACVLDGSAPTASLFDSTHPKRFRSIQRHAENQYSRSNTFGVCVFLFGCTCVFGIFIVCGAFVVAATFVFLLNTHHKYGARQKRCAMLPASGCRQSIRHRRLYARACERSTKSRINHLFRAKSGFAYVNEMDGFFIHLTRNTLILFSLPCALTGFAWFFFFALVRGTLPHVVGRCARVMNDLFYSDPFVDKYIIHSPNLFWDIWMTAARDAERDKKILSNSKLFIRMLLMFCHPKSVVFMCVSHIFFPYWFPFNPRKYPSFLIYYPFAELYLSAFTEKQMCLCLIQLYLCARECVTQKVVNLRFYTLTNRSAISR